MNNIKISKRIVLMLTALSLCAACLFSCSASDDGNKNDKKERIEIPGDYPAKPYIEALANEEYYLDISLLLNGVIIYNTVARRGDTIESRSNVGGSESHTILIDGVTYFIDDENEVYFKADTASDGGLMGAVDYSTAVYASSGSEVLATGKEHSYDEYTCKTISGQDCGVKIFTNDSGNLMAIVDYSGDESVERDVAAFSEDIPEGWLEIPKNYKLVDEDTYFDEYYGR